MTRALVLLALAFFLAGCHRLSDPQQRGRSRVSGPPRGWLLAAGGGDVRGEILERFIQLAGGPQALILVVPTAGPEESYKGDWKGLRKFRDAGAARVEILHTRQRKEANSGRFVRPLESAGGVWFEGGQQWRVAESYLATRSQKELRALLARGGVIGGSSAGASVLASFLVRGSPQGNHIMMAPGHLKGFGFLRNSAIDQHLFSRRRENDLLEVVRAHPRLLGIGIAEKTAILVQGQRLEVLGSGRVLLYERSLAAHTPPYLLLSSGDVFDLGMRQRVK